MAKMMEKTCSSCSGMKGCKLTWAAVLAVLGLLYLGQDMGWRWAAWWNVSWWTAAFLLLAAKKLCCAMKSE